MGCLETACFLATRDFPAEEDLDFARFIAYLSRNVALWKFIKALCDAHPTTYALATAGANEIGPEPE